MFPLVHPRGGIGVDHSEARPEILCRHRYCPRTHGLINEYDNVEKFLIATKKWIMTITRIGCGETVSDSGNSVGVEWNRMNSMRLMKQRSSTIAGSRVLPFRYCKFVAGHTFFLGSVKLQLKKSWGHTTFSIKKLYPVTPDFTHRVAEKRGKGSLQSKKAPTFHT